jgi:phosphotransferase system HPr-like phosphotransfer protein
MASCAVRRIDLSHFEGFSLRSVAKISQLARRFPCSIIISVGSRSFNAKRGWQLTPLVEEVAAKEMIVEAHGYQSTEAVIALEALVCERLSAPPQHGVTGPRVL